MSLKGLYASLQDTLMGCSQAMAPAKEAYTRPW
jgi:hypothetical protein